MRKALIAIAMLTFSLGTLSQFAQAADESIKVMLLTGRSSKWHNWQESHVAIERHLLGAGIFKVEKVITPPTGESLEDFAPKWSDYDVVVMDWDGDGWPEKTKTSFVKYMKNGGGLIVIHASDNAFANWPEFNEMIGVGGWGGRNEESGPRVYWEGCHAVHEEGTPGGATHPPIHDFLVTVRTPEHPITKGLPEMWLHGKDELYSRLRGPAKNMTILATGFANPTLKNASPHNEPLLFTINYGKGRIFHSTLGHVGRKDDHTVTAINNTDFVVTLQRGTEWAATGKVTQAVPDDFPHAYQSTVRPAMP